MQIARQAGTLVFASGLQMLRQLDQLFGLFFNEHTQLIAFSLHEALEAGLLLLQRKVRTQK